MIVTGLTGGIGSGKSTVADAFVAQGAALVDADRITRELQEPGRPAFVAMVERFGDGIVGDDGALDRPAVAEIVFNDAEALADLGKIIHPAVRSEIMAQLRGHADDGVDLVVLDIPLLVEGRRPDGRPSYPMSDVLVVDTPVDTAVDRLVAHRGFDADDARARIAKQAGRVDRVAMAGFVLDNAGAPADLQRQLPRAWAWALGLPPTDLDDPPASGEDDRA